MTTQTEAPLMAAINTDDLQRLVEFAQLVTSAQDAMSDDIVTRLARVMNEGITLLDRLTRNEGLMTLLRVLDQPESQRLLIGFAEALRISESKKDSESKRLIVLRDYFIKKLLDEVPGAVLNGHGKERLPNNVNISVKGMDNDFLVISLASKGILCSTRSACKTNNEKGSHVILALRGEKNSERESLRFSLGRDTTKEKLNTTVRELSRIVKEIKKFEKDIK